MRRDRPFEIASRCLGFVANECVAAGLEVSDIPRILSHVYVQWAATKDCPKHALEVAANALTHETATALALKIQAAVAQQEKESKKNVVEFKNPNLH